MPKFNYFPIIKTTDAELKGYSNLDQAVSKSILPVFELTKSRRSEKNPHGKVEKKIDKLQEILASKPFILDLTTEKSYSNRQIEKLIRNNTNGYESWCEFVINLKNKGLKLYPTIHYHPLHIPDVKTQIFELEKHFELLAFRIDAFNEETYEFINNFQKLLPKNIADKIILILDGKFIHIKEIEDKKQDFLSIVEKIKLIIHPKYFVCPCSGFPKSVTEDGYGGDETGEFKISENEIYNEIYQKYSDVLYGDYASIHPKRYDMAGGYWIPRIDVPLNEKVFYYRYRRKESSKHSYMKAAKKILKDDRYISAGSWGDEEIRQAGQGMVNGRSPSHWIAVRMNIHMTRRQKENRLSIDI